MFGAGAGAEAVLGLCAVAEVGAVAAALLALWGAAEAALAARIGRACAEGGR